jgi:hypothetical protein
MVGSNSASLEASLDDNCGVSDISTPRSLPC